LIKRFMALKKIGQDRDIVKNLSEESKEELELKIKRAESDIPQAIGTTYRHIIVPGDKKELKEFDMGQVYVTKANQISNQVWNILRDQDQLLEKIDPNLFVSPRWSIWPQTKKTLNLKKLTEYFSQYTNLPMISNDEVIRQAVSMGVERGLFAYATGPEDNFDTVNFKETIPTMNVLLTEDAWLLKPEYAKKFIKKPEETPAEEPKETAQATAKTDKEGFTDQGGIKRLKQLTLNVEDMETDNWNNFFREVIEPLSNEGADVKISIKVSAKSDEGIKEDTIELKIKESLQQRNLSYFIE